MSWGRARACGALVDPHLTTNHTSSAAARLSVAAATPEWEIKRKEKEERLIGVGDVVEVYLVLGGRGLVLGGLGAERRVA